MSALAVYLEEEGIATIVIGLVRLHLEKIKPPRALWVPFELGRPLGQPNNPAFQTRVLRAALNLLTAKAGPVILADFPDDEPGIDGDDAWLEPDLSGQALLEEIQQLHHLHAAAVAQFGRTTIGISGLAIEDAAEYLLRYTSADPMPSPNPDMSRRALLRFAVDDIKAFYLEAASAAGGKPSSRQLSEWFWLRTAAAEVIRGLRAVCLASADAKDQAVANSLVPRAWL